MMLSRRAAMLSFVAGSSTTTTDPLLPSQKIDNRIMTRTVNVMEKRATQAATLFKVLDTEMRYVMTLPNHSIYQSLFMNELEKTYLLLCDLAEREIATDDDVAIVIAMRQLRRELPFTTIVEPRKQPMDFYIA